MANFSKGENEGYASPSTGGDGDQDDAAAGALSALEGSRGIWTPEAWHKSPEQLIEEARAMNIAAFHSAVLAAPKHSNPPSSASGI
jgi:hypothetical protein